MLTHHNPQESFNVKLINCFVVTFEVAVVNSQPCDHKLVAMIAAKPGSTTRMNEPWPPAMEPRGIITWLLGGVGQPGVSSAIVASLGFLTYMFFNVTHRNTISD